MNRTRPWFTTGRAAYDLSVAHVSRTGPSPWAAAVLGAFAALLAGVAAFSRHAEVLVHQCVADGTAGAIGLRLALLRQDAACPSGQLAIGGEPRQVVGVVVLIALPVLALHLAGMLAGAGLLVRVRAGLRACGHLLAGLIHVPVTVHVPAHAVRWVPVEAPRRRQDDPALAVAALRGPPPALA